MSEGARCTDVCPTFAARIDDRDDCNRVLWRIPANGSGKASFLSQHGIASMQKAGLLCAVKAVLQTSLLMVHVDGPDQLVCTISCRERLRPVRKSS